MFIFAVTSDLFMINFEKTELSDKEEIEHLFAGNNYRACDFTFTNLYAWQTQYHAVYGVEKDTLFLRFTIDTGEPYYLMPVGDMPLAEALDLMEQDAIKNNRPFQIKKITSDMWAEIEAVAPGKFEYTHDRDNDEYIYLSEKLITLSGKKLQSKRNHINRFKRENPDWEYFSIQSPESIEECREMLHEWQRLNADTAGKGVEYDYLASQVMLDNFAELGLRGGAIRVGGKMIAFTMGVPLTEDTFVIHVEKAFSEINGAYTIINQQFVEHEASEYKYVNREEDMGIENLRKAKQSYYPEILLHEGIVKPK